MRKLLAFVICAVILGGAAIGCDPTQATSKGTIGSGGQPLPPPAPPAPPVLK